MEKKGDKRKEVTEPLQVRHGRNTAVREGFEMEGALSQVTFRRLKIKLIPRLGIQPPFTPTAHQMARATAIHAPKDKKAYSLPMFRAMAHDSYLKAGPMNLRRLKTANIDAM
jgi:hypothetical protein